MKVFFVALIASLVACTLGQSPLSAAPGRYTEKVLYSFCPSKRCSDGKFPTTGLVAVNGTLYGTTYAGGIKGCDSFDCGTIFSVNATNGAEQVIYSFCSRKNCRDGASPSSALADVNGTLYGTTSGGGTNVCGKHIRCGTLFSIDPATGAENVAYSFCSVAGCADGWNPVAGAIAVNGTLYGTTQVGGTGDNSPCPGCGTVYSFDPATGAETVLYSFCSQKGCADGSNPNPALIYANGMLYGTTVGGGTIFCSNNGQACGTAFSVDPNTGAETVLHSFGGGGDGNYPEASLVAFNGMLYGTTYQGGSSGAGVVFSLNPDTGTETVLYSFKGGTDGAVPFSSLLNVKGTLFGTTQSGGGTGCGGNGCGTVYSIDPNTGAEAVVYSFMRGTDGAVPTSGLIDVDGSLYGTTEEGGSGRCGGYGCGTVYVLKKVH